MYCVCMCVQLDLIVDLLGTPNLASELRLTADQARQYVMRAGPRSSQFERLYKLSPLCTHEALALLKRMLTFDPVRSLLHVHAFMFSCSMYLYSSSLDMPLHMYTVRLSIRCASLSVLPSASTCTRTRT